MSKPIDYSIIIPTYRGVNSLPELLKRIEAVMNRIDRPYEVIVVDDSSDDAHWETITKIQLPERTPFRFIRLGKNFGQHHATLCGLQHASAVKAMITIDDDLEYAPEDLPLLIQTHDSSNTDVVYGIPKNRKASVRKLGSVWLKKLSRLANMGEGEWSSYRLINARLRSELGKIRQPVVDLDVWLHWCTDDLQTVNVDYRPRTEGTSGYSLASLIAMILRISFNYSTWPLRVMITFGVVVSIITFLLGLYFICIKVFLEAEIPGFTAIIVALLFSVSILLIAIGTLGFYVSQLFIHLNKKPTYTVKEMIERSM